MSSVILEQLFYEEIESLLEQRCKEYWKCKERKDEAEQELADRAMRFLEIFDLTIVSDSVYSKKKFHELHCGANSSTDEASSSKPLFHLQCTEKKENNDSSVTQVKIQREGDATISQYLAKDYLQFCLKYTRGGESEYFQYSVRLLKFKEVLQSMISENPGWKSQLNMTLGVDKGVLLHYDLAILRIYDRKDATRILENRASILKSGKRVLSSEKSKLLDRLKNFQRMDSKHFKKDLFDMENCFRDCVAFFDDLCDIDLDKHGKFLEEVRTFYDYILYKSWNIFQDGDYETCDDKNCLFCTKMINSPCSAEDKRSKKIFCETIRAPRYISCSSEMCKGLRYMEDTTNSFKGRYVEKEKSDYDKKIREHFGIGLTETEAKDRGRCPFENIRYSFVPDYEKCGDKDCRFCTKMINSKCHPNDKRHRKFFCETKNVIYEISCSSKGCKFNYIGETNGTIKTRYARKDKSDFVTRIRVHFGIINKQEGNEEPCPFENIRFSIVQHVQETGLFEKMEGFRTYVEEHPAELEGLEWIWIKQRKPCCNTKKNKPGPKTEYTKRGKQWIGLLMKNFSVRQKVVEIYLPEN